MPSSKIFIELLKNRGLVGNQAELFLHPDYKLTKYNPFLLPGMDMAVERLAHAQAKGEKVVIYGDYDIDGISATAILFDSFKKFGLNVDTYTPDRFIEGYGLNESAMRLLAKQGADLIVTVDCGSLSHSEIDLANDLGMAVIVTAHHALADTLPNAIAVINPHRADSSYPFGDLSGCGTAFKLVQALQTRLDGLPDGQEKWLLDLVALGTVCDIVPLVEENRNNVYWGIEVLKKTRRPGLKALMAVAKVRPNELSAHKIGFVLGPRLNAAGRLETAKYALDLLLTDNPNRALELAQKLEGLNSERRAEQDRIFAEAADKLKDTQDDVLVVAGEGWNEGVIGIVASKLVEKYKKPTFVVALGEKEAKGSGRSFGDFSLADAIHTTKKKYLLKGGGHAAAGGVTLEIGKLSAWREAVNAYYKSLKLNNQLEHLQVTEDIRVDKLSEITTSLLDDIKALEPFGMGNEAPIFCLQGVTAKFVDRIGKNKDHLKLTIVDRANNTFKLLAFSPLSDWFIEPGSQITLWVALNINEWNGIKSAEGQILRLETK
ncbi:MAG: single-stranded-DNA-specific exonuclease RecJ [Candidatus Nomurabacteria bacterium]|jgi:single-stranded-DNA-specific exonuclease|nr:single-stranded-DNA-specific exonuclease RecJ [Candidatus Nomurabacteria bacterium]